MPNFITYTYLPSEEVPRAKWLNDFAEALPNYAATLAVSAANVQYVAAAAASYDYAVNGLTGALRNLSKSLTTFKDLLEGDRTPDPVLYPVLVLPAPPVAPAGVDLETGIFVKINNLVVDIRKSPNYTAAIGQALGTIAAPASTVVPKPRIRSGESLPGGEIHLVLVRKGGKLIIIEGKRAGGGWELLDKIAVSDFVDKRPNIVAGQSESRTYRVRLSDGANPIGDYSDEFTIATQA